MALECDAREVYQRGITIESQPIEEGGIGGLSVSKGNHDWSSPVEWCNRFVSFGLGYALSLSGVSSCPVGCGASRDLVRMSRLR